MLYGVAQVQLLHLVCEKQYYNVIAYHVGTVVTGLPYLL